MNNSISRKTRRFHIALEVIIAILLILWIYTGISKLIEFYNFRYQLSKWEHFKDYAVFISYAVPISELLIAGLLISKKFRLLGLWASFILMFIFTIYVALILSFAKELPCTCGGVISRLNWSQHLFLNITLTIISAIGVYLHRKLKRNNGSESAFTSHSHIPKLS